jgi:hypothetical protein
MDNSIAYTIQIISSTGVLVKEITTNKGNETEIISTEFAEGHYIYKVLDKDRAILEIGKIDIVH